MKLKKPLTLDSETQYLTHCTNITTMLTHTAGTFEYRLQRYFEITGAELENSSAKLKKSGKQNLCPRCGAMVQFAQDPMRKCDNCNWWGDYTKLVEGP